MKKALLILLILSVLLFSSCQRAPEANLPELPVDTVQTQSIPPQANDDVEVVGNEISSMDAEEDDLNDEELNDIDSGLGEVENI